MRTSFAARMVVAVGLLAAMTSCRGHPPSEGQGGVSVELPSAGVTAVTPSARQVQPDPVVGALFVGGLPLHTCSAAVLEAPAGDLILTAAHCLSGDIDATFVAGFDDDSADEDAWHVDAFYLDPRWVNSQDPLADFAIARVSRDDGGSVQTRAGRGLKLGQVPRPGAVVTVTGYEMGIGGGPISCTAPVADETHGFPSLPCLGLVDGLSGAPWIDGSTVTGIVGGLNGGGCNESASYSPPFGDAVRSLLARAEAGGPADDAPTVLSNDCD